MQTLGHAREQRSKRDRAAFRALITTPANGVMTFPANAAVYLRSVAGCAAGTSAATFNGRTIKTPLLAAGGVAYAGYVERGTALTPASGFDVIISVGLGRVAKIGGAI